MSESSTSTTTGSSSPSSAPIQWLKRKHRVRKPTQDGYRRPADNGDQGTKHAHKKKLTEPQKVAVRATQPVVMGVMDGRTGRLRFRRTPR